jgi:hypothetical protein
MRPLLVCNGTDNAPVRRERYCDLRRFESRRALLHCCAFPAEAGQGEGVDGAGAGEWAGLGVASWTA